ncbi:MAG: hypothetical protein ACI4DU_03015 [Lachnospiraceae bacterium]
MDIFEIWLKEEKNMKQRSAKDVISRCKRIQRIIDCEGLTAQSLDLLLQSEVYGELSPFIRSQLKRALTLFLEFTMSKAS